MNRSLPLWLLGACLLAAAEPTDLSHETAIMHAAPHSVARIGGGPLVFPEQALDDKRTLPSTGRYRADAVELWFPGAIPPTVRGFRFGTESLAPAAWHLEQSDDGATWRTIGSATADHPGTHRLDLPAIRPRGLRLVVDRWRGTGFDNGKIIAPTALGDPAGIPRVPVTWSVACDRPLAVFPLGEAIAARATIRPADGGPADLAWEWLDWYLRPVAPGGTMAITGDGSPVTCRWTPGEQGPYVLALTLRRHGAVLSRAWWLAGISDPRWVAGNPPAHPAPADSRSPIAPLVGPGRMVFSADAYHRSVPVHLLPEPAWFDAFAGSGIDLVGAQANLEAFAPLPGVFNPAYFDHVLDLAATRGLRLEMGVWRYWFGGPDRPHWWLADEAVADQDGQPSDRGFSQYGPRYRTLVQQAVRTLAVRYRNHPALGTWNPQPFGHVDWGWLGGLNRDFDYGPISQEAFRRHLREVRGYNLAALSARYGTPFASWDEVHAPRPHWFDRWREHRTDDRLDLRPQWLDWVEYRHHACTDSARLVLETIRAADPVHPFGCWAGLAAGYGQDADHLLEAFAVPGGANNANTLELVRYSLAQRRSGRELRQEHIGQVDGRRQDPVGEMHRMAFNNSALRTKYFNYVFPVLEDNPAWSGFFVLPAVRRILTELSDAAIPTAPVAALHSHDTDWFEGRNSYYMIEQDRWWRQLDWSASMVGTRWVEWYAHGGRLDELARYPLIIDNHSRVMRPQAEDALVAAAAAGSRLVLWADSGEATYGASAPTWNLLRRLGYPAPERLARRLGRGELVPVPGNGIITGPLPLGDWTPLDHPQATVVATVDGRPAAVRWRHGRGEVLLIGGEEGAPDLDALRRVEIGGAKGAYWPAYQAEQKRVSAAVRPLYADLSRWGVPEDRTVRLAPTAGLEWYHKVLGPVQYLVVHNPADQASAPATAIIPPGVWDASWDTLERSTEPTPAVNPGSTTVDLPSIPPHRMRVLRLAPKATP